MFSNVKIGNMQLLPIVAIFATLNDLLETFIRIYIREKMYTKVGFSESNRSFAVPINDWDCMLVYVLIIGVMGHHKCCKYLRYVLSLRGFMARCCRFEFHRFTFDVCVALAISNTHY